MLLKFVTRNLLYEKKKVQHIKREKDVMLLISKAKYFVQLYCSFQDQSYLYFVMTYARNGELLNKINNLEPFDDVTVRFYGAEILLALELLKSKKIIHRDLKPENIMLDDRMHILIGDFGCSKLLNEQNYKSEQIEKTSKNTFVGTAQFVSPELLENWPLSYATDLWAYGCLLYQMATGKLAFSANSEYLIFRKILNLDYSFPDTYSNNDLIDLVSKLLVINSQKRIGYDDFDKPFYNSIRNHNFFSDIDFSNLGESPLLNLVDKSNQSDIYSNISPGFNPVKLSLLEINDF